MGLPSDDNLGSTVDEIYRAESRRILSTLVRLLGDIDLAEEAMHNAFAAALEQWTTDGIPSNPRAWLVSTARFKAIDSLRRNSRFDSSESERLDQLESATDDPASAIDKNIRDDELRLIFICCHPVLAQDARIALTLREVCGLTTEEIARAYLTSPATMAQRIVRAKAKIREAKIPYEMPSVADLPARIESVLHVIYLVFNEGYSASSGDSVTRGELSGEAIRLCRILTDLLPHTEVFGLLALMLLQESRRIARTTPEGDLILLEDQDRSLWDQNLIREGLVLLREIFRTGVAGQYSLQAAIASVHAAAESASRTDWKQIVAYYDALLTIVPSPVVELNRAVALSMDEGPAKGLKIIDEILQRGELADYYLAHSVRGELCRKSGNIEDARASFRRALELTTQGPEKRLLETRLSQLDPEIR